MLHEKSRDVFLIAESFLIIEWNEVCCLLKDSCSFCKTVALIVSLEFECITV